MQALCRERDGEHRSGGLKKRQGKVEYVESSTHACKTVPCKAHTRVRGRQMRRLSAIGFAWSSVCTSELRSALRRFMHSHWKTRTAPESFTECGLSDSAVPNAQQPHRGESE